jgi:hypothetical protein
VAGFSATLSLATSLCLGDVSLNCGSQGERIKREKMLSHFENFAQCQKWFHVL